MERVRAINRGSVQSRFQRDKWNEADPSQHSTIKTPKIPEKPFNPRNMSFTPPTILNVMF